MSEQQIIIEARLQSDNAFLELCILKMYEKQTEDEQNFRSTTHQNRIGFNKSDGPFFSEIAEWLGRGQHIYSGEIEECGQRMKKYAGQLINYLTHEELEL